MYSIRNTDTIALAEQEKYLTELLAERRKIRPFMTLFPHNYRLLNQEILRITLLLGDTSPIDQIGLEHGSTLTTGGLFSNGGAGDVNGCASPFLSESSPLPGRFGSQGSSGFIVKKTIRVDIPVDRYPNHNFIGRLLGPRGNSLKRVEKCTNCRILIRGRGSIKDPIREEMLRGKPGYEHLSEPSHILVEAEFPVEIIDDCLIRVRKILEDLMQPVDEYRDFLKKDQLRELAMLREEDSQISGSVSPFHNSFGMKRAKTEGRAIL